MKLLNILSVLFLVFPLCLQPSAGQKGPLPASKIALAQQKLERQFNGRAVLPQFHEKIRTHLLNFATKEQMRAKAPKHNQLKEQQLPLKPSQKSTHKELVKTAAHNHSAKRLVPITEDCSFDLIEPIPDLKLAGKNKDEKRAQFIYAAAVQNTKKMYHLVHDPDIADYFSDAKTFDEYRSLADDQRKKMIIHAIDNNDSAFVAFYAQRVPKYNRIPAIKYAAQCNRPRIIATLLQHNPPQSLQTTLANHMDVVLPPLRLANQNHQQDLIDGLFNQDATAALSYQAAQELLLKDSKEKMEKDLQREATLYQTELQNVSADGFKDTALHATLGYLLPSGHMDPRLETAITAGDQAEALRLINEGCLELYSNNSGYHAAQLAVRHGHLEIVKAIAANSRYLTQTQRFELKQIARLEIAKADKLDDANAKTNIIQKYKAIIHFIAIDLPLLTRAKNVLLKRNHLALNCLIHLKRGANPNLTIRMNDGKKHPLVSWLIASKHPVLARLAINYGANVNALNAHGMPIISQALINNDAQYLEMLLASGANPNVVVKISNGKMHPLLWFALSTERFAHAKLLIKHGANVNALDGNGAPIISKTLLIDDTQYLETLLANGANPNVVAKAPDGKMHPLIMHAMARRKFAHAKILLNHGAKADVLDGNGNPIAAQTFAYDDPQLLEILFEDPHNKANPNALYIDLVNKKKIPLLAKAIVQGKPKHARVLIKHGADTNALNSGGNPISFHALQLDDPQYLKILLENKANPNAKIQNEKTGVWHPLLFWAVFLKKPAHARLLIKHGANVNAIDGYGRPIAYIALRSSDPQFVQMFFADPSNKENSESSQKISTYPYLPF